MPDEANVCSARSARLARVPADGAPTILHADLDAFYASVEQLLDPSLRGLPIAVGGSVVLAASYEARTFGVGAGMAGWRARQLCPGLRFVGGHFRDYQRLGDRVVEILQDFTPLVERVSIDEAFLDVSGALHLFGPPTAIAAALRRRVHDEVGLALSVGAARTKHLAKIASQVAKPDGLVVVDPAEEREFLARLPVGLIWGVGPATRRRLHALGITTIGQLAEADPAALGRLAGVAAGEKLVALAGNVDPRRIVTGGRSHSVGAQAALGRRVASDEVLATTLRYLADRIAGRLRAAGRAARTVSVRVRFADLRSVTRSTTLRSAVCTTSPLTGVALELAQRALEDHPGERVISLLGISASQLVLPSAQLELPFARACSRGHGAGSGGIIGSSSRSGGLHDDGSGGRDEGGESGETLGRSRSQWPLGGSLDGSVDAIRQRFGREAIGYASVVFAPEHRVPEAFRELAEHGP
jgi:DNA polymerase-4